MDDEPSHAGSPLADFQLDDALARDRLKAELFGTPRKPERIGRYAIVKSLGSGAHGAVYAGFDERLDRRVAIKLLRAPKDDAKASARFEREARALARIDHPNVVGVHEIGEHDGTPFIAMQYVKGTELVKWQAGKRWRRILAVYAEAAAGLGALHSAGLVHRDFKPANVIVDAQSRPIVVDLGLVRNLGPTQNPDASSTVEQNMRPRELSLTQQGSALGTPAYMSPEQHQGQAIDARTDQFAFCAALYEALYDRLPFTGPTRLAIIAAIVDQKLAPPPASRVPHEIHEVLRRGLALEPGERFAEMDALVEALIQASRRRRAPTRALAALGVGILALAGVVWWML